MDYKLALISFVSGVVITLITALVNQKIKESSEKSARLRESEYEIFLKLNQLYQSYFWFATNELHKKETDDEIYAECHKLANSIAQDLHKNEDSEFTKDLLRIIYDESISSHNERWKAMSELSDRMAAKLTPLHKKLIQELSESNIQLMARSNFVSRAPGSARFRLKV
ncbi:hypothetical protein ACCH70_004415 [Vibrio vulnificus]|uniref:hypothetical protein n=1 Tax=Vibrio vulnificus TaxID=672 RepID=UPI000CD05666|nr:hypothetical protein [Vibrio vulnificus]EGQ7932174.1 hypothetical protein [Vibrio vulnificus]EGQ7997792.1 hypothetical protein [Vibrio vulnificus]EGQ9284121.1 hypothetical protein [Vibrio vulnificus]EGQ9971666.1 hypothetical protein [Vibrio vulnificus]EHD1699154.1 hypothetical protein [Vibrio vulnificus]